jgi:hypothetical protein
LLTLWSAPPQCGSRERRLSLNIPQMRGPYEVSLWLQMSAKARTVAGGLNDPEMKQEMLRIADGYDALAARAAVLVARETKSTSTN